MKVQGKGASQHTVQLCAHSHLGLEESQNLSHSLHLSMCKKKRKKKSCLVKVVTQRSAYLGSPLPTLEVYSPGHTILFITFSLVRPLSVAMATTASSTPSQSVDFICCDDVIINSSVEFLHNMTPAKNFFHFVTS